MSRIDPTRLRALMLAGFLAIGLGAVSPCGAAEPDWRALRTAVVDLEVHRPAEEAASTAVGFHLDVDGVTGIVTSLRAVSGADWVGTPDAAGGTARITEYLAQSPEADLILLKASAPGMLTIGSPNLVTLAQAVFVPTPPSREEPVEALTYGRAFGAAGLDELLAMQPRAATFGKNLTGAPVTDSLGKVIGVIEVFDEGITSVACAVPISELARQLSQPDLGGTLRELPLEPTAAWVRAGTPQHWQAVGAALCRIRQLPDGVAFLNRALEAQADLLPALIELGMAYQIQRDHTKAEEYYRRALEHDAQDARARLYLGSCLFMQGMYLQSQFEYEAAIDAAPDWPNPYVNLAGLYVQQGKTEEGEAALRRAIELDADSGIARSNLGVLLYTQGRYQESREEFDYLSARKSGYASQLHRQTFGKS